MTTRTRLLAAAVAAMTLAPCSLGQAAGIQVDRREGRRRGDWEPISTRYYVLQILGADGDVRFDTVGNAEYLDRRKDYEGEFREARIDWLKAKRDAKKNHEEFNEKAPVGPRIMKKLSQSFRREEDATAYAQRLKERWDEMMEKKREKDEEKRKKDEEKRKKEDAWLRQKREQFLKEQAEKRRKAEEEKKAKEAAEEK